MGAVLAFALMIQYLCVGNLSKIKTEKTCNQTLKESITSRLKLIRQQLSDTYVHIIKLAKDQSVETETKICKGIKPSVFR